MRNIVYRSRLGKWGIVFVLSPLIVGFVPFLCYGDLTGVITGFGILLSCFLLYFGIRYKIEGDQLIVHYAFLYRRKIAISSISSISKVTNFMSAPAFSTKRLKIQYNNRKVVYISPQQERQFIEDIRAKNTAIALIGIN